MIDRDLIREARELAPVSGEIPGKYLGVLADALEAAVARANQLEKALREVPMPSTSDPGIFWDAWEAAQAALARVPEPATEEKPGTGQSAKSQLDNSPWVQMLDDEADTDLIAAGAAQVPADTIEKAPLGFMCPACKQGSVRPFRCGGPHSRPGSKRLHYDFVDAVPVAALAAVQTPEEQTDG